MKHPIILIVFFLLLSTSFALADTVANGTKTVEFGTLPTDPSAGSAAILSFQASDTSVDLSHIDAYVTIKDAQGNTLTDRYYIHTHGNQFSMVYKFLHSGAYTLTVEVEPSDHYEGTPFDPFTVDFPLNVKGQDSTSYQLLYLFGGVIALVFLSGLFFIVKKKKHSHMQHPHQ